MLGTVTEFGKIEPKVKKYTTENYLKGKFVDKEWT